MPTTSPEPSTASVYVRYIVRGLLVGLGLAVALFVVLSWTHQSQYQQGKAAPAILLFIAGCAVAWRYARPHSSD